MLVRKKPRSGNNEANKTLAEKIEDYIKENIDYILNGHAKEVLESKKGAFSERVYLKLNELLEKYSKFI